MTDAHIRQIDHIVIAVHDLAQAIDDYRALGFTVAPGGDHPGRASHNALVVFADGAYLELIAWKAPAPDDRWYRDLGRAGEGLVDFALLPSDTAALARVARERRLATFSGTVDGGRLRPDGVQVRWQTARNATADLPFLCGDLTPRALRVPEGAARTHANGARGVHRLDVAVHEVERSLAGYRALLGEAFDEAVCRPAVDAATGLLAADVRIGNATVRLLSPASDQPDASKALVQRLTQRGEGPCALMLLGPPAVFDPARTHGVALAFAPAG
jgi:catechol 2,3-dioxygenase-like lactoylglutathione lyase family enzyme